ncbi:uncharacterized protein BYT42DRAFT_589431 [Radiomyces spectabilis]|uniref:uncharacterized protein n=1 Tax=Radiomyces spectabilis TaxID=64574 RepID=UPI00221F80CB|nr:uncharacterized protein BYT42DRAFT_589431 [Radiomyces spectabilis]KAI8365279.1 hypothetical protein BYT42DRAFT_589431 [Radiomyces spectabilis]
MEAGSTIQSISVLGPFLSSFFFLFLVISLYLSSSLLLVCVCVDVHYFDTMSILPTDDQPISIALSDFDPMSLSLKGSFAPATDPSSMLSSSSPSPLPPPHSSTTASQISSSSAPPPLSQQQQQHQHTMFSSTNESVPSLCPPGHSSPPTPSSQTPSDNRSSTALSIAGDQLLDHSHLKPGSHASLLSYAQTINMYRENAKKTNSPDIQCDFAIFMVEAAKPLAEDDSNRWEYLAEAEKLLKQLSARGHAESQYYLGNIYASGLLSKKGKNEFDKAFPLFIQASKHHHADASYRAAKCYEDALGSRKDHGKAIQFYRKAAALNHPGAMYRLGVAEVNGELGISKNPRDGVKWLKRAAEAATLEYPHAIHELAVLHERGIENVVFIDLEYAVSLYVQAADLGYPPAAFRLGECFEYGKLNCSPDPQLSIHYYTLAAQQGHREACFALTAWYLVGSPGILPQSDAEAYIWARRAAEKELPKAEYAIGYFTEVGIGCIKDSEAAMHWYHQAAAHGDQRAIQRLQGQSSESIKTKKKSGASDDCTIM